MRASPVMIIILGLQRADPGLRARARWSTSGRGAATPTPCCAALVESCAGRPRRGRLGLRGRTRTRSARWRPRCCRAPALAASAQEEKLQIALSEQRLQLERNLGFLGTMGNTAPLIGLLGTVWGIMRAFHDMARTGSAGPSVVAAGIAEALFTTAAGLLVAVPAVHALQPLRPPHRASC